jgi:hypothetical protein
VTLDHLYSLVAGISSVAVHDKGNVVRDWARFEHIEEGTSDTVDGIVPEPECVLQKRHCGGVGGGERSRQLIGFRVDGSFSSALRLYKADVARRRSAAIVAPNNHKLNRITAGLLRKFMTRFVKPYSEFYIYQN